MVLKVKKGKKPEVKKVVETRVVKTRLVAKHNVKKREADGWKVVRDSNDLVLMEK